VMSQVQILLRQLSKNFQKTKKTDCEGECLSAIVRTGFYYVYGQKQRIPRVV
jgi:hypothetical protein